jgi:hypothetical protein
MLNEAISSALPSAPSSPLPTLITPLKIAVREETGRAR